MFFVHRAHPERAAAWTSTLVLALALGACTSTQAARDDPAETGDTGASSSTSGTSTPSSSSATSSSNAGTGDSSGPEPSEREELLATARTAAAQYDYEGALTHLDGLTGAEAEDLTATITEQQEKAVKWQDNAQIPHLFFHSLIVDPDRAFDPGPSAQGYADYMVTTTEFTAILESVYEKGYVLVNPHDFARRNAQGVMEYVPITLPPGKKPLVLSQDDVSYYEYMDGDGFATNMVIDEDGDVINTYEEPSGTTVEGAYDMPAMVDEFVEEHPDFSYCGSKGILALTGYNGVFGYRTSEIEYGADEDIDVAEQQQEATKVAAALKDDGWVIASHTWGHTNVTDASTARMAADTQKWSDEVAPIVGDTDLMIFPFGADLSGTAPYSGPKYDLLEEAGFDFYFGIDTSVPSWGRLTDSYVRQARINVDGLSMAAHLAGKQHVLQEFFDVEDVIDPVRAEYGF